MADTTIDLLKNSSYVGKMDELIAAVKSGGGTASDVEWNNVKNKPTTIGGYGIIDAKIDNGTITLGNQTITPLTSAPVTSVNSQTGAVVLTANDVSAIPSTLTGTVGQVLTKTADGQEWKDVEIPSGTNDHSKLINRDAADQHPIGAITGLEAALANMPPTDAFIVTLTTNEDGTNSVDKTFAEIQAALQSNRTVYLYAQGMMMFLPLVLRSSENGVIFGYISISSMEVRSIFVVVYNDDHVEIQQKTLSKLPNPNALTFTGAVTGSYDGSEPVTVNIPSGGGGGESGSVGFEVLVDFTTEEAVTEFTIPETVITPIISKIKDASILMMQLNIPRDETDTSVTTTGTVNIKAFVGWFTDIVGKGFNAIIAPSETYNKNWTKNLLVIKAPESVKTNTNVCLIQIFGKKNSANPDALDQRTFDNYFNNFDERTYITVVGSQTMAAGTRFVLGVIA